MKPKPTPIQKPLVSSPHLWRWGLLLALLATAGPGPSQEPVQVTIRDEKPAVTNPDVMVPVDPVKRIQFSPSPLGVSVRSEHNETLHLSHFPTVNIDGQLYQQGGGRVEIAHQPLPRDKGPKYREGFRSIHVFGDVRITCTVTLVPTKPATPGGKRQLDAVVAHYLIENKGNRAHKVGLRIYMDTYVIDNDGCQFASPTLPNRILNGVELKDKTLGPYVQLLQRPNLQAPGYVAHLTLDLGSRIEKADRVVLTQHGTGWGTWHMPAVVAGDTALGVFWEPREIKPGGKRELAYGYGKGIATSPENEGLVHLEVGGSFEPGKQFRVLAYVTDPAPGQSLKLELTEGLALVEGKQTQPVPPIEGEETSSLVMWRARVLRPGEYTIRVHSSTGVRQGKIITVTKAGR